MDPAKRPPPAGQLVQNYKTTDDNGEQKRLPDDEMADTPLQPRKEVNTVEFAGRIGGNQEFSVSASDPNAAEILKKTPDAAPISITNVRDLLHLRGFLRPELYRQALLECYGTALLVYMDGIFAVQLGAASAFTNPTAIALCAAIASGVSLTLFIYTAAPASGGHLNPTITMATLTLGLATFSRAVLYILAQSTGAVIGGFLLRLSLGDDYFPGGVVPGCTTDSRQTSIGQLFVLEWVQTMALVFVAVGVGLDPRQGAVFGPALSPALIGLVLSLILFSSSFAKPGYHGASLNPARCLGLMSANYDLTYHYVHWLAAMSAALCNGLMYYITPPYKKHTEKVEACFSAP